MKTINILSLVIGIVALVIAIIASLPTLSKFFIYHFYHPNLEIFFSPTNTTNEINYSDIVNRKELKWNELETALNIRNKNLKALNIKIEFVVDKPWKLKIGMKENYPESGLAGGYPLEGGFWFRSKSYYLSANSLMGIMFPLIAQPEECSLKIIIYPKIHLSEFGLPRYFGEVDLKPIKKEYRITV